MGIGPHRASRIPAHVEGFPTHGKDHPYGARDAVHRDRCPVYGEGSLPPGSEAPIMGVMQLKNLHPRAQGRSLQGRELMAKPVVNEAWAVLLVDVERPARHIASLAGQHPRRRLRRFDLRRDPIGGVLQADDAVLRHAHVGRPVAHLAMSLQGMGHAVGAPAASRGVS